MKKVIFYFSITAGVMLAIYDYFVVFNDITEFEQLLLSLGALFLALFGAYGLYAESLWKHFRLQGKTENFCVEANYHIRQMGFLGKLFLFPFLKVKSSNSFVVSFLGAMAWIIIISIVLKAFFG